MPRKRAHQRSSGFGLRVIVFAALALALVGAAAYSLWPKERAFIEFGPATSTSGAAADPMHAGQSQTQPGTNAKADLTMRIDMDGFTPSKLSVPTDRSMRLMIVNPDSSHHTDGGGVHEFAVPKLGIDIKVPPETNMIVTLPATAPGEYPFYCDTCCGGKENPTMQGVLKVG